MKMNRILRELFEMGLYLLGVLLLTMFIVKFVGQRTLVQGESMEPTLYNNDNLLVDKVSYRFGDPKRYDIIVLRPYEYQKEVYYIKRIIALPGETIQIKEDGSIYIDGERLYEAYGNEVILPENIGRAAEPITLGEDEYFVMGDNRNHSGDSRSKAVGNVKRHQIIGRAFVRIWPFDRFGSIGKEKK